MKSNIIVSILCIIIVIVLFIGLIFYTANENESIKIAEKADLLLLIKIEKDTYSINDDSINLEIILKNINNNPVIIDNGFGIGLDLWFEIESSTNITFFPATNPTDRNPQKLILENEKKLNINLLDFVYLTKRFPEQIFLLNSTGNYSIKASYESIYIKDTIYSNEIYFKII